MTEQTFEQTRAKVDSLDAILDEQTISIWNKMDREKDRGRGFDPARAYSQDDLEELRYAWNGIDALKQTGEDSKYLLLEVKVEQGSQQYQKHFLRGFEMRNGMHVALAEELISELKEALPSFKFPDEWSKRGSHNDYFEQSISTELGGVKVTVSALGGGKYDLKDNRITLKDRSDAFGGVTSQHQKEFHSLLSQLVAKPAYQGFAIPLLQAQEAKM